MPTGRIQIMNTATDDLQYTSTMTSSLPDEDYWGLKRKIRFYWAAIKWLWLHREEPNNRSKFRRMMREMPEEI